MMHKKPTFLVRYGILSTLFFDGKKRKFDLFRNLTVAYRSFNKHLAFLVEHGFIEIDGKMVTLSQKGSSCVKLLYPYIQLIRKLEMEK